MHHYTWLTANINWSDGIHSTATGFIKSKLWFGTADLSSYHAWLDRWCGDVNIEH